MTILNAFAVLVYAMFIVFSTIVFSCWLHDTKTEMKNSWISSIIFGFMLAIFWPISLTMLYLTEKNNEKKIQ